MMKLECNHFFHEYCLEYMIQFYIESRQLEKATICPCEDCNCKINHAVLQNVLSPELWVELNTFLIEQAQNTVKCPNCKNNVEASISRKSVCILCKYEFCKECCEVWHENTNCTENYILRIIKEMEASGEVVSQCPKCKMPILEEYKNDLVYCINPKCRMEFCFACACPRSPCLAHGRHFHRPDCKHFYPLPEGEKDIYLPYDCKECRKLGELCKPPKQLAVPRRFASGEL